MYDVSFLPGRNLALTDAILIAVLSTGIVVTALAFEYLGGYRACPLCLMQRPAYYAGSLLALLAAWLAWQEHAKPAAVILALIGLGFLANAGLGLYHAGIEWKWWAGPATCSGAAALALDTGDLVESLETLKVVRCDEAPFRALGLSFAGWNVVLSLALTALAWRGAGRAMTLRTN